MLCKEMERALQKIAMFSHHLARAQVRVARLAVRGGEASHVRAHRLELGLHECRLPLGLVGLRGAAADERADG
jgi:hypothetical protein